MRVAFTRWQGIAYLEIRVCCTVQSKETLLAQKQLRITKVSSVKRRSEQYIVISLVLACVCCDCVMYLLLREMQWFV